MGREIGTKGLTAAPARTRLRNMMVALAVVGFSAGLSATPSLAQTAPGPEIPDAVKALIPQAKTEGSVTLQLSPTFTKAEIDKFDDAFEKTFGFRLDIRFLPTQEGGSAAAQKYAGAFRNGIKPPLELFPLAEATLNYLRAVKMIEPVDWAALGVPKDKISPYGDAVLSHVLPINSVFYNTNKVKAEDAPKRIQDLADPKWKGQIVTVPQGIEHIALAFLLGKQQGLDLYRKIVQDQKVSFVNNPGDAVAKVASGEFAIGYGLGPNPWIRSMPGAPVAIAHLEKIAGAPYKLAVFKSQSGHVAAAKMLAYFICCTANGKQALSQLSDLADFDTPNSFAGDVGRNGAGVLYTPDFDINQAGPLAKEFSQISDEK